MKAEFSSIRRIKFRSRSTYSSLTTCITKAGSARGGTHDAHSPHVALSDIEDAAVNAGTNSSNTGTVNAEADSGEAKRLHRWKNVTQTTMIERSFSFMLTSRMAEASAGLM